MDLSYTADQTAFRTEVRDFLATNLPQRLSEKVRLGKRLTKGEMEEWHAILNARGWLAPNWLSGIWRRGMGRGAAPDL